MKVIKLSKECKYLLVAKEYEEQHAVRARNGRYILKWLGDKWFDIDLYNSICRKHGLI